MVPPGRFMFADARTSEIWPTVSPSDCRADGLTSTWISRSTPPRTAAWATPSTCSIRLFTNALAVSFNSLRTSIESYNCRSADASATVMTGCAEGSTPRIVGRSDPRGSDPPTRSSFSRTSSRAKSMAVPHANSTVTVDVPSRVMDRILFTPATVPRADSIGSVTACSTSSGEVFG